MQITPEQKMARITELKKNAMMSLEDIVSVGASYYAIVLESKTQAKKKFYLKKLAGIKNDIKAITGDIDAFDRMLDQITNHAVETVVADQDNE